MFKSFEERHVGEHNNEFLAGYSSITFKKKEFVNGSGEILNLITQIHRSLLKPQATLEDILAFGNFGYADILDPEFHQKAAIEVIFNQKSNEPVGYIILWSGHENGKGRNHLVMSKDLAMKVIRKKTDQPNARNISFSVIMNYDDSTLVEEGFTEEELIKTIPDNWHLLPDIKGKKPGEDPKLIVNYHKMPLTKYMFDQANLKKESGPQVKFSLPTGDLDTQEIEIKISQQQKELMMEKVGAFTRLTVRKVLLKDFPALKKLHNDGNPHPSFNELDINQILRYMQMEFQSQWAVLLLKYFQR